MATITADVLDNGVPVQDAVAYVGEVNGAFHTDTNGTITRTVPSDFAVVACIIIETNGVRRGSFGPILLKADGHYVFDIGATGL